jgi:hypothetical protein
MFEMKDKNNTLHSHKAVTRRCDYWAKFLSPRTKIWVPAIASHTFKFVSWSNDRYSRLQKLTHIRLLQLWYRWYTIQRSGLLGLAVMTTEVIDTGRIRNCWHLCLTITTWAFPKYFMWPVYGSSCTPHKHFVGVDIEKLHSIPDRKRILLILQRDQTGSGAHPASY